jgi:hypothetical protein
MELWSKHILKTNYGSAPSEAPCTRAFWKRRDADAKRSGAKKEKEEKERKNLE